MIMYLVDIVFKGGMTSRDGLTLQHVAVFALNDLLVNFLQTQNGEMTLQTRQSSRVRSGKSEKND